jgi:hypothetical protein
MEQSGRNVVDFIPPEPVTEAAGWLPLELDPSNARAEDGLEMISTGYEKDDESDEDLDHSPVCHGGGRSLVLRK